MLRQHFNMNFNRFQSDELVSVQIFCPSWLSVLLVDCFFSLVRVNS